MIGTPRASRPLRILQCVDNFDQGGTQAQLVTLVNSLATDTELELHVACLRRRGPLLERLEIAPGRIREYPMNRFHGPAGIRQMARLSRAVAVERFDIVHAHDFYSNVLCASAIGWAPWTRLIVSRRYEQLSTRRVHAIGERWSYALADRVVLNSSRVAASLIERGTLAPSKAVVVPNAVDLGRFAGAAPVTESELPPDAPVRIGIVATLLADKAHEVLLEAIALIRRTRPRLELVIVGDGPRRAELGELARALRIDNAITFAGEQGDVTGWLPTFDIAVLCSHREGLPNALLEYLAAGRPVVATRVGGIPEVITDGREGVLVAPGSAPELAVAIETLLASAPRRAAMAAAGRRRAADFGIPVLAAAMRRLYTDLATRRQPASPRQATLSPHFGAGDVRHLR